MLGPSVKLGKPLWNRIKRCAEAGGYSSPKEFIQHVLERELAKLDEADSDEEIMKKLQGLGYID